MARRLFTLLSALSLLLCVAVVVLWARSYWVSDILQHSDRLHAAMTAPGGVWFTTASRPYWDGIPYQSDVADAGFYRSFGPFFGYTVKPVPGGRSYAALGFVYLSHAQASPPPACRFTYVAVPLWLPGLLSLVMPAIWLRRRRARTAAGFCRSCGYDLRATPGRCPECGRCPQRLSSHFSVPPS